MIVVSKCLAGECCRYDGGSKPDARAAELVKNGLAVPVCPEQLGGLPTPRCPSELTCDGAEVLAGRGRVVMKNGADVTGEFIAGAQAALRIARECGAKHAILKAHSPSCGCGLVYDGSFTGRLVPGRGVTAALFEANGITIETI